jgi:hypothetical protein
VLENDVGKVLRPMTLGKATTLSITDLHDLARWAFKMSLMIDLIAGPVIPLGFYREFALVRRAPDSSVVWLGAYKGERAALAYHRRLDGTENQIEPTGLVTTFTAFRVVFQVLQHFTSGNATVRDERVYSRALHIAWPTSTREPCHWPRANLAFRDEDLERLAASVQGPRS